MVSNSAKLDRRTKQHTESGVSTSDSSRDMARIRSCRKKRKKKKNKLEESHKASPTGINNNNNNTAGELRENETGSRSPCMRPRSDPPELWSNNEANWMVSNSAKLDRRTKQHTQFGVSASNGSRDMAQTKSWRKKKEKIKKKSNEANWMVSNSAKLDRRTKQHTQFGVSASNGSRDMARTKSWREKKKIK